MTSEASRSHPRDNPKLFGHEDAERLMLEAYNSGRLPHAWLIGGVRGIGKATLAYRFARFLLANGTPGGTEDAGPSLFGDALLPITPTSLEVEPQHPTFRRMVAGGHADICVIEPTNKDEDGKEKASWEIRVWQVRKLAKFLHQSASETAWRIVLVDDADKMNPNAANALLKLLEEPPANTVLLLVSHNPGRLLPTIRSRCRQLPLRPLADEVARKVLEASTEGLLHPDEADFAIALADGAPGHAVEIYEQGGLDLYKDMLASLQTLPKLSAIAVQDFGAKLARKENQHRWQLLAFMFGWFVASTVRAGVMGEFGREFTPGEKELKARLLQHSAIDHLAEVWEKTSRAVAVSDGLHMDRQLTVAEMFGALQATGT